MHKKYYEDEDIYLEEDVAEREAQTAKRERSFVKSQLLILLQAVLCAAVLVFALTLKAVGGSFYAQAATWYFDRYNDSVFTGTGSPTKFIKEETVITEISRASFDELSRSEEKVKLCLPLKSGAITSQYGEREYNGEKQFHKGIDIAAEKGSKIYAVLDGIVNTAGEDSSYGNYIVIEHDGGMRTLYAHCNKLIAEEGKKVSAGDIIAEVGETGDADGTHLHFEVIENGKNTDPSGLIGDAYK